MPRRTSSPTKDGVTRALAEPVKDDTASIEERRDALVLEKRTELSQIYDRHDDLVREIFHMKKFRIMTRYDPAEVKNDQSNVFLRHQAEYDLLLQTEGAGPSRRTRTSQTQRALLLPKPPPRPPTEPREAPPPPRSSSEIFNSPPTLFARTKGKGKARANPTTPVRPQLSIPRHGTREAPSESDEEELTVTISARSKGKQRAEPPSSPLTDLSSSSDGVSTSSLQDTRLMPPPPPPTEPPDPSTVKLSRPVKPVLPQKRRRASDSDTGISSDDGPAVPRSPRKAAKKGDVRKVAESSPSKAAKSDLSKTAQNDMIAAPPQPATAPARTRARPSEQRPLPETPMRKRVPARRRKQGEPTPSAFATPKRAAGRPKRPVNGQSNDVPAVDANPSTKIRPRSTIKSVNLIVRRPPPVVTNPFQVPDPARHGHSLPALLDSYILDGDRSLTADEVNERARHDAQILERYHRLCAEGEILPLEKYEQAKAAIAAASSNPLGPRSTDVWAHVVREVEERYEAGKRAGKRAAKSSAQVMVEYRAREAKRQEDEQRRVERLAKETMKLIVRQWVEAVKYVREQERRRQEAEEIRLGHKRLDALLDKSEELLELQQGALGGRSTRFSASSQADSDDESDGQPEDSDDEDVGDGEDNDSVSVMQSDVPTEQEEVPSVHNGDEGSASSRPTSPPNDFATESHRSSSVDIPLSQSQEHTSSQVSESSVEPTTPADFNVAASSSASVDMHPWDTEGTTMEVDEFENSSPRKSIDIVYPQPSKISWEDDLAAGPADVDIPFHDLVPQSDHHSLASDDDPVVRSKSVELTVPDYLTPYAVAPVQWHPKQKVQKPLLLRGELREYQQHGLEWLANLHTTNQNGILADEMGLGKTIQTIALLAHLACDRGIWGPHLIIVPTSVILNWEMEFKKFLPGFKVLAYHGNTTKRRDLRKGWNDKYSFNVCITSYALATRDVAIFKRRSWYYMILDEAHMIKNFKSQRWNLLLMFKSFRRLLLTGTPLQNNLTELWALLQFLKAGSEFASQKEFGDWFSNPLEKAIEMGNQDDEETQKRVEKLRKILRSVMLRRLKSQVEKQLPKKHEHDVLCPLSKRQRFLYDEFMSRAQTQAELQSGVYQKIANILMQLRKVCNHPDLFEVRPIVTSFAMSRSAIADYEIKELLVRRRFCIEKDEHVDLDLLGLRFIQNQGKPLISALEGRRLDYSPQLKYTSDAPGEPPPKDLRTIAGFRAWKAYQEQAVAVERRRHLGYVHHLRCSSDTPIIGSELLRVARACTFTLRPWSALDLRLEHWHRTKAVHTAVASFEDRAEQMRDVIDRFAFATPPVVARDIPSIALASHEGAILRLPPDFDSSLHRAAVKLQIAFPDPFLLQFDCGKLQYLADLLREKKAGGHRVLIFTQMTRILDILEVFLNFHGYLYLRLDGATKIEDRQYVTERFNADDRVFCFIASSRSGGVGINLTGADTVVFYDSDFNPQMDRQCEDRAHRIGQIRDVHIYRFVSQHTVEEAMLRKANQKRSLDSLVIQRGEYDWRRFLDNEQAVTAALAEVEDRDDAHAAAVAMREANDMDDADQADFEDEKAGKGGEAAVHGDAEGDEGEGGSVSDYMISLVVQDYEHFAEWRT
ncbi:uncharacterized protein SCHCODRAFT_02630796 [Schizophyllum commune H4-8]|uniref:uncharacterized protein n=1 Tax=Schizophyllum commune (strain H4-8 / FGSC 9210) TaxID=578458 RepID=UPI00215E9FC9|nr:uncharacterized protein SCHCODRAFT_02630796 [Schizophyllum commune H4-8]KAI5890077.1 hypothetical protein SCHCODRAFT_02630796 [Schizophyllum commune H4-8]